MTEETQLDDNKLPSGPEEDLYQLQKIVVDPKQSPLRIDKFLFDRFQKISRNKIQNAIQAGAVTVNNKTIKSNHKVKPGEEISVVFFKPYDDHHEIVPEDIPLDIRYEDEDIMIIHKPAGLVVHPGVGNRSGTLVNALAHYLKNRDLPLKEGNFANRAGLVHRIDKNTSGLLAIAKNDLAMSHLAKQFFDHTVDREYLALVWGEPEEDQGTITGHIGRHPTHRVRRFVFPEGESGKHSITHFRVLERMYYVSLVSCKLETGRTHQIRVHMNHLGHPLFNDSLYGGDRIVKGTIYDKYRQFVENSFKLLPRQALHARSLGFIHPRTGVQLFFEADLPEDFQKALNKWRNYIAGRKSLQ